MADLDLFVIGGGSGGVACARRAASHGAKVALAEAGRVGGTCVIRGCIPKKLMHYGAHFAESFRAARSYGWRLGEPGLDFAALIEARNREIARLNGVYIAMLENAGVTLVPAWARIVERRPDDFVIEAGSTQFTARQVMVAVGARPSPPEIAGLEHAVSSDEVLEDVYPFPNRVVIVGAGYIGVELAGIFAGLGAETTLTLRGDLPLRGFDQDLRQEVARGMEEHGVRLRPDTRPLAIETDAGVRRLLTSREPIEADLVVLATGRHPLANTRELGLAEIGVRMGPFGVVEVDAGYRSSVPGLYAIGDCSDHAGLAMHQGQHDLTPLAIVEGRAVAEALFNVPPPPLAYETVPTAVFGLPQASSVGLTEADARERGHEVEIYRTRFRPLLHTLTGAAQRTMMKLVVDKADGRVLGCHMVGEDAAEIIQGFAVALTAGATKAMFDATVALHPTAAEEFVTMYQPVRDN